MRHRKLAAWQKQNRRLKTFHKAARDIGCEDSEAEFDAALGKVARHQPPKEKPKKGGAQRASGPLARGVVFSNKSWRDQTGKIMRGVAPSSRFLNPYFE